MFINNANIPFDEWSNVKSNVKNTRTPYESHIRTTQYKIQYGKKHWGKQGYETNKDMNVPEQTKTAKNTTLHMRDRAKKKHTQYTVGLMVDEQKVR